LAEEKNRRTHLKIILLTQKVINTLQSIQKDYKRGTLGVISLGLLVILGYGAFRGKIETSLDIGLKSKTLLIILFLVAVPVVVSLFNQKLRRIPLEWCEDKKLRVYRFVYSIKIIVLLFISVSSLTVFVLTGDFKMLVFLLAAILFLYFDKPTEEKIQSDLRIRTDEEE